MKEKESDRKKQIYSVGIYARLSVDHRIKRESIASQIAAAKAYLTQQEGMKLYNCYIDLGESGTHFKRNGFLKLMEDIREKRVNCIIVKDFSRFGRNYIEVENYIDKIFPFLGLIIPEINFPNVDFPDPFFPIITTVSLSLMVRFMFLPKQVLRSR